jgi:3-methyl-2-oxobutanoate hydroxymethyltransferase
MSIHKEIKKVTTNTLLELKRAGEKISMLTAYDYTLAQIIDKAGIEVILVGDSASNVMAGHETTLPITLDQMIYHASSVILSAGIPVMGHLGLTPQSIYKFGTYAVRAKEKDEADRVIQDAKLLEQAGCFAIVLEKIPAHLATKIAQSVQVPVIGIGAGNGVDGQVLVLHDMLGLNVEFKPRFLRRYLNLFDEITGAVGQYVKDVKSADFPNENEQY